MPATVIRKPDPLTIGVTGLEGAFKGAVAGEEFKEDKRRYDTTHEEGVRQFDVTQKENVRQFDEDLGFRIEQLEALQREGLLNRRHEGALETLRQQQEGLRQTKRLESEEVRTQMQVEQQDRSNIRTTGAQNYRTSETAKAEKARLVEDQTSRLSDKGQMIHDGDTFLKGYDQGDIPGQEVFLRMTPEEQRTVAEQFAAVRVGAENFDNLTPEARERQVEHAGRVLGEMKEIKESYTADAIEMAHEGARANVMAQLTPEELEAYEAGEPGTIHSVATRFINKDAPVDIITGMRPLNYTAMAKDPAINTETIFALQDIGMNINDLEVQAAQIRVEGGDAFDMNALLYEQIQQVDETLDAYAMDPRVRDYLKARLKREAVISTFPEQADYGPKGAAVTAMRTLLERGQWAEEDTRALLDRAPALGPDIYKATGADPTETPGVSEQTKGMHR
jgi:hypothetical protein